MEQFSRECLEIDSETQHKDGRMDRRGSTSMDKVYDRAAKLVKRTLDVEGVVVMDVSHCEVLETMSSEASVSIVMHHGDSGKGTSMRAMSTSEYAQLNAFFAKYPDGKIFEGIVPPTFRPFLPTHIQYALSMTFMYIFGVPVVSNLVSFSSSSAVPIFNVDKRPFALLCAYNATDQSKRFVSTVTVLFLHWASNDTLWLRHFNSQLEGHELSYLRAIGTGVDSYTKSVQADSYQVSSFCPLS
jgi:hypothetical protein